MNSIKNIILLLGLSLIAVYTSAQQAFVGTLTYSLSYLGNGMEDMAEILPNSIRVVSDGNNIRIDLNGGMVSTNYGYFIIDNRSGNMYIVNDEKKAVWRILKNHAPGTYDIPIVTDTKVDEPVKKMICRKYRVDATIDNGHTTSYLWINRSLILPPVSPELSLMIGDLITLHGVEGTVIKQMILTDGASTTIMLDSIIHNKPDAYMLQLPSGYPLSDRDFDSFTNGF